MVNSYLPLGGTGGNMADQATPAAAPAATETTQSQPNQQQPNAPANAQQAANAAESVINDPKSTAAQKVAAVKKLKSLKIKVDGQEIEEKLPFEMEDTKENREWMAKQLQFSKVSQKRMGEKAQLETEVRSFLEMLKKDPKRLLSDPTYGVDLKKLAAQMIEEEIANAAKSPDQLEKEKLQRELQEMKEQRDREKKDFDAREQERLTEVEFERFDTLMTKSLEGSDLPKSPYVIKKFADYLKMGIQEGLDVTPEDVLPLVKEEILQDIQQMTQAMPLEAIEKLFGGDILTKIRKRNVAKAKSAPTTNSAKLPDVGATPAGKKDDKKVEKKTIKQMFGV